MAGWLSSRPHVCSGTNWCRSTWSTTAAQRLSQSTEVLQLLAVNRTRLLSVYNYYQELHVSGPMVTVAGTKGWGRGRTRGIAECSLMVLTLCGSSGLLLLRHDSRQRTPNVCPTTAWFSL